MPNLEDKPLTHRQEKFCKLFVKLGTATVAAREAGFSDEDYGNRLKTRPHIQKRIQELQGLIDDDFVHNAESVISGIWGIARTAPLPKDKLRAYELLGKSLGLFVDRKEVGKPGEFKNLSAEELDARIEELAPAAGFELKRTDGVN